MHLKAVLFVLVLICLTESLVEPLAVNWKQVVRFCN